MPTHAPLLGRLRRRISGFGALFVLLLLGKLVLSGSCYGDGLGRAMAAGSGAAVAAVVAADGQAIAAPAPDADSDWCWHAGAGGCHCNCTHSAPVKAEYLAGLSVPHPSAHGLAEPFDAAGLPAPFIPLRPPIG